MTTIAIDFGTSNTLVSLWEPDIQAATSLRFAQLSRLFKGIDATGSVVDIPVVPTVMFLDATTGWMVGEQVRSQRLGLAQPDRLFKAFKRDFAADFQPPPRQIDGQSYSIAAVCEHFLNQLWQSLQAQQIYPSQVIFTIPVEAFERYLTGFQAIADQWGVAARFVDEPTAAALGYAVQRPGALVLVLDFGGGTLDLSLVRTVAISANPIHTAEVVAKSGAYVGGEEVDRWIVEHYLRQLGNSRTAIGEVGWHNLLAIAERLKIRLSSVDRATESWLDETSFMSYEICLDRAQLEDILETQQLLEQVRQAMDEVLAIALGKGIRKADIERVLLVGGSCLIPSVQQLVVSYFGRQRVQVHKPFEAVVHGALMLSQVQQLDDYLHHSYAIHLWEPYARTHAYYLLFERGTAYPCTRAEPLILQVASEGQSEIRLDIGEVASTTAAEVVYDAQGRMTSTALNRHETYRSLDQSHDQVCIAHLTPVGQVGVDRVSVQFEVDEYRVLLATVRDLLTNQVLVDRKAIATLR
ncbi:MAG: Hsp70 family protein [Leptolyngbyaceae cyanobacterium SL_7_1]|nr:Hsp70 family protein [Leptolyngbyaceae cyanobacterium SL_7_1]